MDNQIQMESNVENEIKKVVEGFYEAFCQSDRIKLFSYLNTSFQNNIPLNHFLVHSDFDIDVGILIDICSVCIEENKKHAFVECCLDFEREKKKIVIVLISEEGVWKIDGKSIFKRKL